MHTNVLAVALRALAVTAGLALFANGASAQIYRCTTPEGQTIFSDRPCGTDVQNLEPPKATRAAPARPAPTPRSQPEAPTQADPVGVVVTTSQEIGIVSKYQLGDIAPSISVRPAFHQMDIEHKRAIGVAFLVHAQRQRPDAEYQFVMIRDSRNNNTVGNYDERLGLRLRRDYR